MVKNYNAVADCIGNPYFLAISALKILLVCTFIVTIVLWRCCLFCLYGFCREGKLNSEYNSYTCTGYESETIANHFRRVISFINLKIRKKCNFSML